MPFLFERAYRRMGRHDGVLAVFGAPDRLADHADRAVAAARDVAEALTERFGPEPSPFGPESFRFGIGV